jgi:hypothetical protein
MDLSLTHFLIFMLWGNLIGFFAGLFGIGGGGFVVPLLILSYNHLGVSPSVLTHMAVATSLVVVFFASLTSAYQHNKQRNTHWRAAIILGLSSALTAVVTVTLAVHLSGRYLRITFALVSVILALRIFAESSRDEDRKATPSSRVNPLHLGWIGMAGGVVSGLAGVGGGGITITMMYLLLKMPLKLAIGTSSVTMVITSFFAAGGYIYNGISRTDLPAWCLGFLDFQRGIALVFGSLMTARIGAYVSFKTHPYLLRKLFALFLTVVSIYIIFVR